MEDCKYLAIKNWEKYQPTDRLRKKNAKLPWVKSYTDKEDDYHYQSLTCFQRAVLDGIQRLRGRLAKNVPNDASYIARALYVMAEERHCIPQAIRKLIASGFLVPTNEQLNLGDREGERDGDREREEAKQTARVEPVAELPKTTTKPTLAIVEPHVFELPVWLNQATWTDYELMRRKKGAPMTNRARELIVGKLKAFMEKGQNPERVLEESIANNWTGVFELKERQNGRTTDSTKPDGPSAAVEILRARLADRGLPRPAPNAGNAGLPPGSQDSRRH